MCRIVPSSKHKIMNSIIQEDRAGDVARITWVSIVIFVFLLPLSMAAQDCKTTAYLETQTIKAGELVTIVAGTVSGQPGKQFIIEKDGHAVLQAGKRIELNNGFKVLTGGGLFASIVPCDPNDPPPTEEPVAVFPNPTDGIINIKSPYKISALRLLDMSGFLQLEKTDINATSFELDISHVKPGFYILEILADKSATETVRIEKK
jgi:hypothetical protein